MEILLIALLTVLNGVFAMSELALASSRKARLAALAESGDKGAAAALQLMDQPTRFLSTVQVGITSIGILNGIIGEAAFSDNLARWLNCGSARCSRRKTSCARSETASVCPSMRVKVRKTIPWCSRTMSAKSSGMGSRSLDRRPERKFHRKALKLPAWGTV